MGLLDRFFGSADPTRDWPVASGQSPQVSHDRRALESIGVALPFGADLDAARVLGRPDHFKKDAEGVYTLTYARWGLLLEYEASRFVQVSYVIDPESAGESVSVEPADARGPDGMRLSPTTTQDEIVSRFGTPGRVQTFDEDTILYFTHGPLASEFHLESGRLVRWEVYLD